MWWQEPVTRLKGIGPKKALEFENINVVTIGDLLNHFPRPGMLSGLFPYPDHR